MVSTPVASRPGARKYLGDSRPEKREVHDLHREKARCRIDEVIESKRAVVFSPDTREQAHLEGYGDCPHCIGESRRTGG